ncbi:hypothetical protein FBU30_011103 [Linnemannia zychae]|nr:hypothetical protein FBU30_011103 [Linnemannia zychae]
MDVGFFIDLSPSQSSKRTTFNKPEKSTDTAEMKVPHRSMNDDDWSLNATKRNTHPKNAAFKRKGLTMAAKQEKEHSTDAIIERFVCTEIPSFIQPSSRPRFSQDRILRFENVILPNPLAFRPSSILENPTRKSKSWPFSDIAGLNSITEATPDTIDIKKFSIKDNVKNVHGDISVEADSSKTYARDKRKKPGGQSRASSISEKCNTRPVPNPYPSTATNNGGDILLNPTKLASSKKKNNSSIINTPLTRERSRAVNSTNSGTSICDSNSRYELQLPITRNLQTGIQSTECEGRLLDSNPSCDESSTTTSEGTASQPSSPEQKLNQCSVEPVIRTNFIFGGKSIKDLPDETDTYKEQPNDAPRKVTFALASTIAQTDRSELSQNQSGYHGDNIQDICTDNQRSNKIEDNFALSDLKIPKSTLTSKPSTQQDLSDPLTGPLSVYARVDINKVISFENYSRFPVSVQKAFVDLLPPFIRENSQYLENTTGTASELFFNMPAFHRAKLDWQHALVEGKFTDEYKDKVAVLERESSDRKKGWMTMEGTKRVVIEIAGHHEDEWKSDEFERFYGEKAIRESMREMEAGDSSKTSLAKICVNRGLMVGDILLYSRAFSIKPSYKVIKTAVALPKMTNYQGRTSMTVSKALPSMPQQDKRRQWISRLLKMAMLNADHDSDNKTDEMKVNGKGNKQEKAADNSHSVGDCIVKIDELIRVVRIEKTGKPVIEFVDNDSISNSSTVKGITDSNIHNISRSDPVIAKIPLPAWKRSSRRLHRYQTQQQLSRHQHWQQSRQHITSSKTVETFEVDSALAIERLCLEKDGQIPKEDRKNASESWKHIHVFRTIGATTAANVTMGIVDAVTGGGGRGNESASHKIPITEQNAVENQQNEVYVGSLFGIRMDIYNHLQSENAKVQAQLEE